jgi:hypothetical protein
VAAALGIDRKDRMTRGVSTSTIHLVGFDRCPFNDAVD